MASKIIEWIMHSKKIKHNDHENEEMKFSMKITQRFRDPLSRQANEAVRISSRKKDELLNSKNEFNHFIHSFKAAHSE